MLDDLRVGIFAWLLGTLVKLVPRTEVEIWVWLSSIPIDNTKGKNDDIRG